MQIETSEKWFAAQTKTNGHYKAQKNLENQGFKTFLPLIETSKRSAKKFITKSIPLFPGYIFVSFSMSNLNWRSINSTLGVKKLVESNKIPQCIPQEFIASLKHRCDKEGKLVGEETLNVGAKVRIVKGPFTEMIGTIEKIDAKDRITLLLDFMGKDTKALFVNSYMKYIC